MTELLCHEILSEIKDIELNLLKEEACSNGIYIKETESWARTKKLLQIILVNKTSPTVRSLYVHLDPHNKFTVFIHCCSILSKYIISGSGIYSRRDIHSLIYSDFALKILTQQLPVQKFQFGLATEPTVVKRYFA